MKTSFVEVNEESFLLSPKRLPDGRQGSEGEISFRVSGQLRTKE